MIQQEEGLVETGLGAEREGGERRCAVFTGTPPPMSQADSRYGRAEHARVTSCMYVCLTVHLGVSVCLSLCLCVSGEGWCTGGTPAARSYFYQLMPQHYL